MKQNKDNNTYYFESYGKNIDLYEYFEKFRNKTDEKNCKIIIYIKKDENISKDFSNHVKVRSKKPYDFHINYNKIVESAYIDVSINISDKEKTELKETLEDIRNYILNIIPNIKFQPLYINNPNKENINKVTFICKFIPDFTTKKHRIYEIKEYLTKLLWNKERFPFERVKKGFTDLSDFKNKLIESNKNNQKIKIFPDFEPILIIQKYNGVIKVKLEYNIRQIYFVKPEIVPEPIA
jgi:hypothetical protein